MREQAEEGYFPFDIICDPQQELYHRFDIGANAGSSEMSDRLKDRVAQARARGIVHGRYEGNEEQSPATFLIDRNGVVRYVWYGTESSDVPAGKELLCLLEEIFETAEQ